MSCAQALGSAGEPARMTASLLVEPSSRGWSRRREEEEKEMNPRAAGSRGDTLPRTRLTVVHRALEMSYGRAVGEMSAGYGLGALLVHCNALRMVTIVGWQGNGT